MKKILMTFLITVSVPLFSQINEGKTFPVGEVNLHHISGDTLFFNDAQFIIVDDAIIMDTMMTTKQRNDSICKIRGHVPSGVVQSTGRYCPPYYEDTEDATYMVYPACNYHTFTCMRCGKEVTQKSKEKRILIWQKPEEEE